MLGLGLEKSLFPRQKLHAYKAVLESSQRIKLFSRRYFWSPQNWEGKKKKGERGEGSFKVTVNNPIVFAWDWSACVSALLSRSHCTAWPKRQLPFYRAAMAAMPGFALSQDGSGHPPHLKHQVMNLMPELRRVREAAWSISVSQALIIFLHTSSPGRTPSA